MFSSSMTPRHTAVTPAESEMVSDVTSPIPFADYDDKESSLVQAVPHPPAAESFTTEMPYYPDSLFSIKLPDQSKQGGDPLDTPHVEYSGSEDSSGGDVDAPEVVLSTSPAIVTASPGDPEKPAIVYKEDESTDNTTQEGLIVPVTTIITPGVIEAVDHAEHIKPMTGDNLPLSTDDQIPVNVLFVGIPEKNDSAIDMSREGKCFLKK